MVLPSGVKATPATVFEVPAESVNELPVGGVEEAEVPADGRLTAADRQQFTVR